MVKVRRAAVALAVAIAAGGCQAAPGPVNLENAQPTRRVIATASQIMAGANEFPLTRLRVFSPRGGGVLENGTLLLTGSLIVHRHSTDPNTFDPTTLFFEYSEAATGTIVPSETVLLRITPNPSYALVEFETELPAVEVASLAQGEQVTLGLAVYLGAVRASARVTVPVD